MSKISPIRIATTAVKAVEKKVPKAAPKTQEVPKQCAVDLSLEEYGLWKCGDKIVQQIFPR